MILEDKISTQLKLLRENRRMGSPNHRKVSMREVAESIDVDPRAYANWEQGRTKPAPVYLMRLADYFDVTIDYIVGRGPKLIETKHLTWKLANYPELTYQKAIDVWKRSAEGATERKMYEDLEIKPIEIQKLIRDAIYTGFVRIEKVTLDKELSRKLKQKYGLLEARVLNFTPDVSPFRIELLGYVASEYLTEYVKAEGPNLSLGIVGGFTVSRAVSNIRRGDLANIAVYPLVVHPATSAVDVSSNTLVGKLAYRHRDYSVKGHALNASCFTEHERDEIAQHILHKASAVDIVLAGIGTLEFFYEDNLLQHIIGSTEEIERLRREEGAVGDILFHLLDRDGNFIKCDINDKLCSIRTEVLDGLVKIRKPVIAIVSGQEKFEATRGVLKGKHANVIITDQATAKKLHEA